MTMDEISLEEAEKGSPSRKTSVTEAKGREKGKKRLSMPHRIQGHRRVRIRKKPLVLANWK